MERGGHEVTSEGRGQPSPPHAAPRQGRSTYHAGLTREAVVAAAVEMLRVSGPSSFSLRRLAAHLGVDTMALYKHVRNKDDLLGAALARAFGAARPSGGGPWWEQLAHVFREHRRVVVAEPWVQVLLFGHHTRSAEPWSGVDEALALLEPHLGAHGAARWLRWLAAYTNGFLLTEQRPHESAAPGELLAERPRVGAAAARNAEHGEEDFEAGLTVLVDAMRAEADARRT